MRKFLITLLAAFTVIAASCTVSPEASVSSVSGNTITTKIGSYPYGGYPYGASLSSDNSISSSFYSAWKSKYITSSGAGGNLRVDNGNGGTYSEGIGYGMIIAAYMNDRATFDGLWRYAKAHLDANGLMHWSIDGSGNVVGANAATDGDEDMAIALVFADKKWGGYTSDATSLIQKIYQYEVESGTYCLKPGDVWGGSSCLNPSYFAPAFFKVFAQYTGNSGWNTVVDVVYQVLNNSKNSSTGLVPDWCQQNGSPASGKGYTYSYDACRTPMRVSLDYLWFGESRAQSFLTKMIGFFAGVGAANIKSGYNLDGSPTVSYQDAAFIGPIAAGACAASVSSSFKSDIYNTLAGIAANNYYNDCLKMLCLLIVTGNMPNPLGDGGNPTSSSSSTAVISSSSSSSMSAYTTYQIPGKIEAENFTAMSGIQTENCSEGTLNVGWIDNGDWLEYKVNIYSSATYTVSYRVANYYASAANINFKLDGNSLGTTTIPVTGAWQNWTTVTATYNLPAGSHTIRLQFDNGGLNINWFSVQQGNSTSSSSSTSSISSSSSSAKSSSSSSSSSSTPSGNYVTVSAPFSNDGAGEFYWQMSSIPSYINGWNLDVLDINGVSFLNKYASASALPAKQNGYYYIHYKASYSWSHFEAK